MGGGGWEAVVRARARVYIRSCTCVPVIKRLWRRAHRNNGGCTDNTAMSNLQPAEHQTAGRNNHRSVAGQNTKLLLVVSVAK